MSDTVNIEIRPISTPEDIDAAAEMMRELHEIHVKSRPDLYSDADIDVFHTEIARQVDSDEGSALIACAEGIPEAFCLISLHTTENPLLKKRKIAIIEAIYVRESERRRGMGEALYNSAVSYAKAHKADAMQLSVSAFNGSARSFYDAVGMKLKGSTMERAL